VVSVVTFWPTAPAMLIVSSGGQLLVDDIYCAGTDPSTTDAYASGWDGCAACAS
jgi:hypothetical protein